MSPERAERRTVRGLPVSVVNTRPDIRTEHVLHRLDGALALIERHQPWRFRRLRRDLAEILVIRYPCRAAYDPRARACIVELTFLANPGFSEAQIAASIVHEGVHARLDRMGLSTPPSRRSREERLCRKAEVEFGLAVPGGEPVVARALAALELEDQEVAPAIDWAEAARRVAQVDRDAAGGA
ncbi:MAG TPA: hypothetical protein VFS05_00785 [Gemmatimonadaceae bacterium]|nr:hypothetical protein [Gemmatimonadaceae bacterium]